MKPHKGKAALLLQENPGEESFTRHPPLRFAPRRFPLGWGLEPRRPLTWPVWPNVACSAQTWRGSPSLTSWQGGSATWAA